MTQDWLYGRSEWFLFFGGILLFALATEVGIHLRRRTCQNVDDTSRSLVFAVQGAILGLLALLMGFTFSMALGRYDTRKQLVLAEANAIGTTYLRAAILPEPMQADVRKLLRDYVDIRLEKVANELDASSIQSIVVRSEEQHGRLWDLGTLAAKSDPRSVMTGLFLQALNEVIDLHSMRVASLNNHVPEAIIYLLYVVAFFAMVVTGYGISLGNRRHFLLSIMLATLVSAVMMVILDLDRPGRGLIRNNQQAMQELKRGLAADGR